MTMTTQDPTNAVLAYGSALTPEAVTYEEKPGDENPDNGWLKEDRAERLETGLFISDAELFRRLGVGSKTGRLAVSALDNLGFPRKDALFGNKRYWPAVREFLDRYYGLSEPRISRPQPQTDLPQWRRRKAVSRTPEAQ